MPDCQRSLTCADVSQLWLQDKTWLPQVKARVLRTIDRYNYEIPDFPEALAGLIPHCSVAWEALRPQGLLGGPSQVAHDWPGLSWWFLTVLKIFDCANKWKRSKNSEDCRPTCRHVPEVGCFSDKETPFCSSTHVDCAPMEIRSVYVNARENKLRPQNVSMRSKQALVLYTIGF